MSGLYTLGPSGEPVPCHDPLAWSKARETEDRQVAFDEVGRSRVSTVFLGIDHNWSGVGPPVLWETMVFDGPLDMEQERYASRADALAGHAAMVVRVKENERS